jgi:hypothetical protein
MPGINVGPSMGFGARMAQGFKNLGQNAPGVVNALAQNYGGGMSGAAKATGNANQGRRGMGQNRGFTSPMRPQQPQPMPQQGGMVRMPNISFGGPMNPQPTGGMPAPRPMPNPMPRNTGITGGMFGGQPPAISQQPPPMVPDSPMGGGGNLWNMYSQLANRNAGPMGQQYY